MEEQTGSEKLSVSIVEPSHFVLVRMGKQLVKHCIKKALCL